MADKFNPNMAAVAGMEWPVIRSGTDPLDPTRELAVAAPSTVAETVQQATVPWSGPLGGQYRQHIFLHFYNGLPTVTGAAAVQHTFLTAGDGATTGTLQGGAFSAQDAIVGAGDGKFARLDSGEYVEGSFGVDQQFTGRRILGLILHYQAALTTAGTAARYLTLKTVHDTDATWNKTYGRVEVDATAFTGVRICEMGEVGPRTRTAIGLAHHLPWLAADLNELRFPHGVGNGRLSLRLDFDQPGTAAVIDVDYMALEVVHSAENRVGLSGFKLSNWDTALSARAFNGLNAIFNVYSTAGATGFSKTAAGDMVVTMRTANAPGPWFTDLGNSAGDLPLGGAPLLRWGGGLDALPLVRSYRFPTTPDGVIEIVPDSIARLYCLPYQNAGSGNGSVDAQAYSVFDVGRVYDVIGFPGTAGILEQTIDLDTSTTYTKARFLARQRGTPPSMEIQRSGTPATGTLDTTLFASMPDYADGFKTVTLPLLTPLTGLGTSGVLTVHAAAGAVGDLSNCWEIPVTTAYDVDYGADTHGSSTYGGTSFRGQWRSTNQLGEEIYLLLTADVPAVSGFAASIVSGAPVPAVTGCAVTAGCACGDLCVPSSQNYVHLEWTTLAITGFAGYQVQRNDCHSDAWEDIAVIPTTGTGSFNDYEARVQLDSRYRIRALRNDGEASAWSAEKTILRPAVGDRVMWFTSNEQPALNVGYPDMHPSGEGRSYEFLDANEVVFAQLVGRDMQVAFRPSERRGDRFTRNVLIYQCPQHPIPSAAAFVPLREIAEADVNHIAVLDDLGNRWYAALRVPNGNEQVGRLHVVTAQVEITEVSPLPVGGTVGTVSSEIFGSGVLV